MKKYLLIFLPFLFFAQKRISDKEYNILNQNQKMLYDEIYSQTINRNIRINDFLKNNPHISKYKFDNDKVYVLYDIIENNPVYRSVYNVDSAIATNTHKLQPGGELSLNLDGSGMTVAVWDGGPIQITHPEFIDSNDLSRINIIDFQTVDGVNGDDDHGTHVGGTIAAFGVNPDAKGMAINVRLDSYNFNNDNLEMVTASSDPFNPIILSNHSYGVPASNVQNWALGQYTNDARAVDNIISTNPFYLPVYSAGNSGNFENTDALFFGSDKLTGDKVSKNNLVVANCNGQFDPFSGNITYNINTGSSQGPTDDLRIKPDITADGTNVFSTTTGSNYSTFTGTSMSAPNTTGTLVLLQQYYNQLYNEYMKASTLKGLVIHTARDDSSIQGPDHIFGWGILNAEFAANTITDDNNDNAIIDEIVLNNNSTYSTTFSLQSSEKLIATLCWTDPPGTAITGNSNLNNTSPRLVNDLDIRLFKDGIEYFPWRLELDTGIGLFNSKGDNIRDNVEKIEIDNPIPGTYSLVVSHKGNLVGTDPFSPPLQEFSLIVTGENLTLNNESFSLNQIKIFPNPTTDFISVSGLTDEFEYDVFNIQGKVLNNGKIDSINNQIDLSSLSNGIYIVRINNGDNFITKKIIKK